MVHGARSLGFYLETGAMGEFYAEECLLTQLCLTLCDALDCSPPGCSVHGISQARILERAAISFSRVSS